MPAVNIHKSTKVSQQRLRYIRQVFSNKDLLTFIENKSAVVFLCLMKQWQIYIFIPALTLTSSVWMHFKDL